MKAAAAFLTLFLALALLPPAAAAESLNGAIYQTQGGSPNFFLMFSFSGQTFVVTMLAWGPAGNGRWFAAFGASDGVSGGGQVLSPQGFGLAQPTGSTFQFQLDGPDAAGGSFSTTGLDGFLPLTSGRFVRIFP